MRIHAEPWGTLATDAHEASARARRQACCNFKRSRLAWPPESMLYLHALECAPLRAIWGGATLLGALNNGDGPKTPPRFPRPSGTTRLYNLSNSETCYGNCASLEAPRRCPGSSPEVGGSSAAAAGAGMTPVTNEVRIFQQLQQSFPQKPVSAPQPW